METEASHDNEPAPQHDSVTTRPLGLLEKLIKTSFFQILVGNSSARIAEARNVQAFPKDSEHHQALPSIAVDVIFFAILVLIAPLLAVVRLWVYVIHNSWWIKFLLGIGAGGAVLFTFVTVIRRFFQ